MSTKNNSIYINKKISNFNTHNLKLEWNKNNECRNILLNGYRLEAEKKEEVNSGNVCWI